MSTRRGQGEGSISQRASDGLCTASVDLGYVNGKRKRKQIYDKTRKEVAEKLKVMLRDQQQGLPIAVERQTVEQFMQRWLTEVVQPNTRPKTHHSYSQLARLYIYPDLGHMQVSKLSPQDVQTFLNHRTSRWTIPSNCSIPPSRAADGIEASIEVGPCSPECRDSGRSTENRAL